MATLSSAVTIERRESRIFTIYICGLNRLRCRLGWWVGLTCGTVCYMGVTIPKGEGVMLGKNVPDEPNTPMNCKLNWSMQGRAHVRGRCFVVSVRWVYYRLWKGVGLRTMGEVWYLRYALLFYLPCCFYDILFCWSSRPSCLYGLDGFWAHVNAVMLYCVVNISGSLCNCVRPVLQ